MLTRRTNVTKGIVNVSDAISGFNQAVGCLVTKRKAVLVILQL